MFASWAEAQLAMIEARQRMYAMDPRDTRMRMLEISAAAFDEIAQKLLHAGYHSDVVGMMAIDLAAGGIVLTRAVDEASMEHPRPVEHVPV